MTKFEAGKEYSFNWYCEDGGTSRLTIVSRTEKTVVISYKGEQKRKKVYVDYNGEYIMPAGSYSMAPVCRAKNVYEAENTQEEMTEEEKTMTLTHEEIVKELREIGKYLQEKGEDIKARYGENPEFANEQDEWHYKLLMQACKTVLECGGVRPYISVSIAGGKGIWDGTYGIEIQNTDEPVKKEAEKPKTAEWTDDDFHTYFPNGEIHDSDLSDPHPQEFKVNEYVRAVRTKYWDKFFSEPRFIGRLTSNLLDKYRSQVNTFVEYDFSYWNIKTVQEEIVRNLVQGVENCIIDLFDRLSVRHSWDGDIPNQENIHYYNGWKTNLSWKINHRVIIPVRSYDTYSYDEMRLFVGNATATLMDIEKVLNYLDNGETGEVDIASTMREAEKAHNLRKIKLKYCLISSPKMKLLRMSQDVQ